MKFTVGGSWLATCGWCGRRWLYALGMAAFMVAVPAAMFADTVILGTLPIADVKIVKFESGRIFYSGSQGEQSKLFSNSITISITDEPALNAAEAIFAKTIKDQAEADAAAKAGKPAPKVDLPAKWSDATDNYLKALRSTTKAWLKDYVALRLQICADNCGRFDAAVAGWLQQVQKNPAEAGKRKPVLPTDPASTYLKAAMADLQSLLGSEQRVPQRQLLLQFELDICQAMRDDAGMNRVAGEMQKLGGDNPSPDLAAVRASAKLAFVNAAIQKQDFKTASARLDEARPLVTGADQQADLEFLTAEIHNGMAITNAATTADGWKDAALDYMKFVADFPAHAKVADALLKTAQLHEKFDDAATAAQIYQSIVHDFAGKPAAVEAGKNLDRLKPTAAPAAAH